MKIIMTELSGVYIVQPKVFGDERGWFMETYSKIKMSEVDREWVQDNHSYSKEKGVLRGVHFQKGESAQAKLVRCVRGAVLDVAVDLRKNSPNYKKWVAVELSADNHQQLFIPRGFGHGFVTLTENVEFVYKTDNYYSAENDRSIRYDDPALNINWGVTDPILSNKDKTAPLLNESDVDF